jgi:NAD(P)-dependent dehydrogenase (short-subunit alcohol dehydrogenase family)
MGPRRPPAPIEEGGWEIGYRMSRAAVHRQAGILAKEPAGGGVLFFNIEPGLIGAERMAIDMASFGFDAATMSPPDVIGAVAAWLVGSPDAADLNGQTTWLPPRGRATVTERKPRGGWPRHDRLMASRPGGDLMSL